MDSLAPHINRHHIKNLHPLSLINPDFHDRLLKKCLVLNYDPGEAILHKHQPRIQSMYLLKGVIEIRESFFSRQQFQATEHRARYPIEESIATHAAARAKSEVQILAFNRDYVDYLLARSETRENNVAVLTTQEFSVPPADSDWMWNLSQSPLFANLPPSNIQHILSAFDDLPLLAGTQIINKGDQGEYFYVIKEGRVKIVLDKNDNEFVVRAQGDYFGEDALMSDDLRSADVFMQTDGVLARLSKQRFKDLVQSAEIEMLDPKDAKKLLSDPGKNCCLLDIRMQEEFSHQHQSGSQNIPLASLRQQIPNLDYNTTYLLTAEGGRRSALAAQWMRQSGFNSYVVKTL